MNRVSQCMTSASELFHIRRHRLGRNDIDSSFHSSPSSDFHHHHRLHDSDDDDSPRIRRHYNVRRLRHHERVSERFDGRYRRSLVNEGVESGESVRGAPRASGSERLPVDVRLARERLLQRLRGDPVDRNRQNDRDSVDEDQESELSSEVPTEESLITDLTSQMARFQLLHEQTRKPPGLTQEALNCLHLEVFSSIDTESESKVLQDCGICLESFVDGDKLIHLQCGHKFHSACLDPWIRSCGDCPYCRRCIVVNSHLP